MEQLEGVELDDIEEINLETIDLGLAVMKEVGAKWLVGMAHYIMNNPKLIVNGFIHSGITPAMDSIKDLEGYC